MRGEDRSDQSTTGESRSGDRLLPTGEVPVAAVGRQRTDQSSCAGPKLRGLLRTGAPPVRSAAARTTTDGCDRSRRPPVRRRQAAGSILRKGVREGGAWRVAADFPGVVNRCPSIVADLVFRMQLGAEARSGLQAVALECRPDIPWRDHGRPDRHGHSRPGSRSAPATWCRPDIPWRDHGRPVCRGHWRPGSRSAPATWCRPDIPWRDHGRPDRHGHWRPGSRSAPATTECPGYIGDLAAGFC